LALKTECTKKAAMITAWFFVLETKSSGLAPMEAASFFEGRVKDKANSGTNVVV